MHPVSAVCSDSVAVCEPGHDVCPGPGLLQGGLHHGVGYVVTFWGVGQLYVACCLQRLVNWARGIQGVLEWGLELRKNIC